MQKSDFCLGHSKHRKSGKSNINFTGKKGGKPIVRKGKGKNRKQRRAKRGSHTNKYAHLRGT